MTFINPIVEALNQIGITADFNSRNDLVIDHKKISGNSQYIRRGHVLHHGSLLFDTKPEKMMTYLQRPEYKIKATGIKSVRDRTGNISDYLKEPMTTQAFRQHMVLAILNQGNTSRQLSLEETKAIEKLADQKYRSQQWTYGKNPQCHISQSKRFKGGTVMIHLNVDFDQIKACHIFGDFFANGDLKKLEEALTNVRFNQADLYQAVEQASDLPQILDITPFEIIDSLFGN